MKNLIIIIIYTLFYLYYLYKFIKIINHKSIYKNNYVIQSINIKELYSEINFKKYTYNDIIQNINYNNKLNYFIIPSIYTIYPEQTGYYLYIKILNNTLNENINVMYIINDKKYYNNVTTNKILRFYSIDQINLFKLYISNNNTYKKIMSLTL